VPLHWEPPYLGSQKSLVPDILLQREETTVIVDAKYKDHWEDMQQRGWAGQNEELREHHRQDLLQVLAYSTIAPRRKVLACLAYPCREATWTSLREGGRLFHRAAIPSSQGRRIELLLAAFPLSIRILPEATEILTREIVRLVS
jgi:5-methylcytosine-specific restriction endonuclease McrBC regulatory subunit McrC